MFLEKGRREYKMTKKVVEPDYWENRLTKMCAARNFSDDLEFYDELWDDEIASGAVFIPRSNHEDLNAFFIGFSLKKFPNGVRYVEFCRFPRCTTRKYRMSELYFTMMLKDLWDHFLLHPDKEFSWSEYTKHEKFLLSNGEWV
ncbi:MAG: hypothetical protein JW740_02595 [Candidatus Zambryskibacteria bacterium]|nr:hypothetical protein [Candidatus Zambryskibacteria bacterium]